MRDGFVSYATPDSRHTLLVCAGLRALGITLWLDVDDFIRSRSTWRDAVHGGIAASRNVVVSLSADWAASPACRYELAIALERRKPIVAVALGLEPSARDALSILPRHAEVVDASGGVASAIDLVGARLAHRVPAAHPVSDSRFVRSKAIESSRR